jgi:hypothetical protein
LERKAQLELLALLVLAVAQQEQELMLSFGRMDKQ